MTSVKLSVAEGATVGNAQRTVLPSSVADGDALIKVAAAGSVLEMTTVLRVIGSAFVTLIVTVNGS